MTTGQMTYDMDELLHFYAESGLDIALSEEPVDQFAASQIAEAYRKQQMALSTQPAPQNSVQQEPMRSLQPRNIASKPVAKPRFQPTSNQIVPDAQQIALAKEIAASAGSLQELRERLAGFDGCGLKFTAKNLCFEDGNPASGLMFIGDVPGRDEDMEGLPFAGRAGQLFDNMLRSIGLTRDQTYLANMICWRPPGNRVPTPLEIELCQPFIERQIALAKPKVIVGFGGPVTKLLTNATDTILRVRGNWLVHHTETGAQIPVMPSLHPAYLLRSPAQKRFAWQDLLSVKTKLNEINQ
ncbi:uracil-DNA glycosylase [Paenochrobactrum pullorum]|uniref:uracil-DNA glycosylase n=1 Tax=Paenochrobactrum pullorum TaxID=1324351 RepID=UPI0035BC5DB1